MSLRPRPHQVAALDGLARTLAGHDRAQLVMACGTGKTLVGRWHAEAADAAQVVVLVPSLALVAQALGEWRRVAGWPFEALVVCSDPSTSAGAAERASAEGSEIAAPYWARARARVTTSSATAAAFLRGRHPQHPQVVFSTYHSAPVIAQAQAATGVVFDLAVCDEAHRLAGRPRAEFRAAIDRRGGIVARKRVYMTATPQVVTGDETLSMDDHATFGPVAHTLPFGTAIGAGLLADYQVLVVAGHDQDDDAPASATAIGALRDAVDHHHLRRVLTFHTRVARAAAVAETLDGTRTPAGTLIRARHLSGAMPAGHRAETLAWLAGGGHDEVRLISSARCLVEGVDVPAVDGAMFADQRSSTVDIIQATGRVLRPAPGKTRGTIIVPVTLPPDGDDDSALTASAFGHVWTVLRGLRAHDPRLAQAVDAATRDHARGRWHVRQGLDRVRFVLPDDVDERALQVRLVEQVGQRWEHFYGLLCDHAEATGGRLVRWVTTWKGAQLGKWAEQQRIAHRAGLLATDRVRRLEQVPGWAWDRSDGHWRESLQRVGEVAAHRPDGLTQPAGEASIYAGHRDSQHRPLGTWVADQRQRYRDGMLADDRAEQLAALPGWSWNGGLPDDDVAMIQALRVFGEFEKHADVPDDHVEDGLPLGRWLWAVRRRKLTGQLHPTLAEEIAAATPRGHKGAAAFHWHQAETQWRLAYSALRAYARREGHATPPVSHTEPIAGTTVRLGQWASLQRFKHRRGELDPTYVGWLEALPGWKWEVSLQTRQVGEPLDLGGHPHGTAKGVTAGCPCHDCLETRRDYDRRRLARRRQIPDGVPAGRARRHLQRLEEAGALRATITAVSGIPVGILRNLGTGRATEISRRHEAALLATTPAMCAAAPRRAGTRGRVVSADSELVDAGPTLRTLADLAARGFGRAWVGRELGYASTLQLTGETITRRIARAVADLADRVGDRTAHHIPRNRTVPPLAQLIAAEQGAAGEDIAS